MQKVVVIVASPEFTSQHYDQTWEGIKAAGHSNPKGLISPSALQILPEAGW